MSQREVKYRQIDIRTERDVWLVVGVGSGMARRLGLPETDCVRIETAISEMARNVLLHGGGGVITVGQVAEGGKCGLRISARDAGPGISDISQALQDGFTTRSSLGIGLGVTKRLMDDVTIRSHPGWGTIVTVTKWSSGDCIEPQIAVRHMPSISLGKES